MDSANVIFRENEYPTSCTNCGVIYQSARHYFVHSQKKVPCRPKPYTCSKCGRIFNYYWNLIAHEKRKFPCNYKIKNDEIAFCFKRPSNIENNIKIEKPVTTITTSIATITTTTAISNNSMTTTITNKPVVHKGTPLICQKCGVLFRYRKSFYKHCKKCNFSEIYGHMSAKVYDPNVKPKLLDEVNMETEEFKMTPNFENAKKVSTLYPAADNRITPAQNTDLLLTKKNLQMNSNELSETDILQQLGCIKQEKNISIEDGHTTDTVSIKKEPIQSDKTSTKLDYDEDQFICKICNYSFISAYSWSKHMKKHPSFKLPDDYCFKCPICDEAFYSAYILFRHQKKSKHWKNFQNVFESKDENLNDTNDIDNKENSEVLSFTSEMDFLNGNFDENDLTNTITDSLTAKRLTMKLRDRCLIRKKIAHAKMRIKNKAANATFAGMMSKKIPSPRPKCNACGRFLSWTSPMEHYKFCTLRGSYSCKWCPERFKTMKRMTVHQQIKHRELLPFECLRCKQRFPERSCTLNHISQLHKDVPKFTLVKERIIMEEPYFQEDKQSDVMESLKTQFKRPLPNESSASKIYKSGKRSNNPIKHNEGMEEILQKSAVPPANINSNFEEADEKSWFQCSVCTQVFHNVTNYLSHSLNHFSSNQIDPSEISESKPYECKICLEKFSHHQKVQIHFLLHLKSIRPQIYSSKRINTANNNNVLHSSQENGHTKARLQIAKKSISSRIASDQIFIEADVQNENTDSPNLLSTKQKCCKCSNYDCKCLIDSSNCELLGMQNSLTPSSDNLNDQKRKGLEPSSENVVQKQNAVLSSSDNLIEKQSVTCFAANLDDQKENAVPYSSDNLIKKQNIEEQSVAPCFPDNLKDEKQNIIHCSSNNLKDEKQITVSCSLDNLKDQESNASHIDEKIDSLVSNKVEGNCIISSISYSQNKIEKNDDLAANDSKVFKQEENIGISERNTSEIENNLNDTKEDCMELNNTIENHIKSNLLKKDGKSENNSFHLLPSVDKNIMWHLPEECASCQKLLFFLHNKSKINSLMEQNDEEINCNVTHDLKHADSNHTDVSSYACSVFPDINKLLSHLKKQKLQTNSDSICADRTEIPPIESSKLKNDFSQLLYLLINDPELMQKLGWGQKNIEDILEDVLSHLGQVPIRNEPKLERFRSNIMLLLQVCIKDTVIDELKTDSPSVDDLVFNILEMCKDSLKS